MSRRFDAVLFDFSGTLFDDGNVLTPCGLQLQAAERGVLLGFDEAATLIHRTRQRVDGPRGLAEREGCDRSAERHRAVWTRMMTESADGFRADADPEVLGESLYACLADPGSWPAYPDTASVLKTLHAEGLKLGVVSNIGWDIRPTFDELGVTDLIDSFVLSCEHDSVKPEPDLFRIACAELGVEESRALFVGDDPVKDGAAARVGLAVYVLPSTRHRDQPRGLEAVLSLAA
ncbi:HAD family hydrolase [Allokutzneria sp. A3M-2-11 16]|uniref:HAD family hydrolase n=1 Tax=Allokutzneria sp. A3M-2-11 16 TaxID=2962043 RepID=UPI0020B8C378|nr:HAD family hydrolase [Allokutzneria sp. A3M-2-11 16]MCP3803630.1 HAD family hydrolase [Allokutzneria sp. A3M-2-11 16]